MVNRWSNGHIVLCRLGGYPDVDILILKSKSFGVHTLLEKFWQFTHQLHSVISFAAVSSSHHTLYAMLL